MITKCSLAPMRQVRERVFELSLFAHFRDTTMASAQKKWGEEILSLWAIPRLHALVTELSEDLLPIQGDGTAQEGARERKQGIGLGPKYPQVG